MTRQPVSREAVVNVAKRTGLPESIVRDMLWYGWTYSETINTPATWTSPITNMHDGSMFPVGEPN